MRSILSFRLLVQGDTIGALNLYSRRPAAFDPRGRAVGSILAAHAAIALTAASERQHVEQLEEALRSSREVALAMGVSWAAAGSPRRRRSRRSSGRRRTSTSSCARSPSGSRRPGTCPNGAQGH